MAVTGWSRHNSMLKTASHVSSPHQHSLAITNRVLCFVYVAVLPACTSVHIHCTHTLVPRTHEARSVRSSGTVDGCGLPRGCWKSAAEPFIESPKFAFWYWHQMDSFKLKESVGAYGIFQQLGALPALSEDSGSVSRTQMFGVQGIPCSLLTSVGSRHTYGADVQAKYS